MEDWEIVDFFYSEWRANPHNEILIGECRQEPRKKILSVFSKVGDRLVWLSLLIGIRKGLTEQLLILDSTKFVQADKLVTYDISVFSLDSRLTRLDLVRKNVEKGMDVIEACKLELERVLASWKNDKEAVAAIQKMKARSQEGDGSFRSVPTIFANIRN